MNQKEIYQALKSKSLNASMIAEALGVSSQAVSMPLSKVKAVCELLRQLLLQLMNP